MFLPYVLIGWTVASLATLALLYAHGEQERELVPVTESRR